MTEKTVESRRSSPRFAVLLFDIFAAVAAILIGLALTTPLAELGQVPKAVLGAYVILYAACNALTFFGFRLYRTLWSFTALADLVTIVKASILATSAFIALTLTISVFAPFDMRPPVVALFLTVSIISVPRLFFRLNNDGSIQTVFSLRPVRGGTDFPMLLVGLGARTESFLREIRRTAHCPYDDVGIIDTTPGRERQLIHGVEIHNWAGNLDSVIRQLKARRVIVRKIVISEVDTITQPILDQIIAVAAEHNITVARLPRAFELHDAKGPPPLQPMSLEDLLPRQQVSLDKCGMRDLVAGQRVLITGAGGSIGSELVRQVSLLEAKSITLVDNSEFNLYRIDKELEEMHPELPRHAVLCDIRDLVSLKTIFGRCRPDVILHAAALKHVPLMEINPSEAALTNVIGTRNVANLSRKIGARAMVLVSTDKAVNPTNVMGATKRLAECYCQALDLEAGDNPRATRYVAVRFGNVLGSAGSVVPLFQRQLAQGGPLTVTHPEMRRYFMTIPEAVQLILQACVIGLASRQEQGKIFVLDMGEPVRISDLARKMIMLAGKRPDEEVRIEYVGLRPGEKLSEELFHGKESIVKSEHEGYFIAKPRTVVLSQLQKIIDQLEEVARARDHDRVRRHLHLAVPEFTEANGEIDDRSEEIGEKTASTSIAAMN